MQALLVDVGDFGDRAANAARLLDRTAMAFAVVSRSALRSPPISAASRYSLQGARKVPEPARATWVSPPFTEA